ncbi:DUF6314 family protein [Arthrobacter sp. SO5]|uniref:DUF6314 family protein n=1 Tax=Arthrobacter sp. SO5 TaxID=1897055 RepID=UPI001E3D3FCC|nr:DUF6314 family protein [Arthrobacter sp. SO5]
MNAPAPETAPDLDLRGYLLGIWTVERTLLDRANGTRGTFTGVVSFTPLGGGDVQHGTDGPHDGGLRLHEEGTISWTSFTGKPFTGPATRDYLLRGTESPETMDMFFPDGRPFHRMGFGAQDCLAQHWCDPDTYRVSYARTGADEFRYRWDVTGPAKDQVLDSVLRRRHPGSRG